MAVNAQLLKIRIANGEKIDAVAAELGVSIRRDGRGAAITPEQIAYARQRLQHGHALSTVAGEVGCSESGLRGAIARDRLRDWIQDAVMARAASLHLTAYEIAKRTQGGVSEDHVRAYLTREKSMGSHKLQHVLRVLALKLTDAAQTYEHPDRIGEPR